jgi:hypothetical protein
MTKFDTSRPIDVVWVSCANNIDWKSIVKTLSQKQLQAHQNKLSLVRIKKSPFSHNQENAKQG